MTIVAIDAGTSAIKAAVIADDGEVVNVARVVVPARRAAGNDPDEYWCHVINALRQISEHARAASAVTVTGQGDGLWTLDASGRPAGLAYEWNSNLAADVVREWELDGTIAAHFEATGTVLWPGTTAALWKWLADTDPEHLSRVEHVLYAKDWISYKLSGEIATDISDATIPFIDVDTGDFSSSHIARLGCATIEGKLAPIRPQGETLGVVTSAAADETGLAAGTPVLVGCLDGIALASGAGLKDCGDTLAVLGTTAAAVVMTDSSGRDGDAVGATLRLQDAGRFLRFMGSNSGTSTLDWYLGVHGLDIAHFWSDVAAGRPGVSMLPYLSGERVPFLAPDATGTFMGITTTTTRADISRAVAHGISFSLRHCLEAEQQSTGPIVLTGGGSSSAQWCQIVADAARRTVVVDDRPHIACLGVASLVADIDPVGTADRKTYEPSTDLDAEYGAFVALGQQLRPIWSQFANSPKDPT